MEPYLSPSDVLTRLVEGLDKTMGKPQPDRREEFEGEIVFEILVPEGWAERVEMAAKDGDLNIQEATDGPSSV